MDIDVAIAPAFNIFSRNAEERNDENLLVIRSAELAAAFEEEFGSVFENAQ